MRYRMHNELINITLSFSLIEVHMRLELNVKTSMLYYLLLVAVRIPYIISYNDVIFFGQQ